MAKTKAPAELEPQHSKANGTVTVVTTPLAAGAHPAASAWPAWAFYVLLVLGFAFPPFWWLGVAAGCRSGRDRECLVKFRTGLSAAQRVAWWLCLLLSLASAAACILVLAIVFGHADTQGAPAYYVTLTAPTSAMPEVDASRLAMLASALHAALGLPASYPTSALAVWLESSTQQTAPAATRHLLQTADSSNTALEFGFSLLAPSNDTAANITSSLEAQLPDASVSEALADDLAAAGFVPEDKLGLFSMGLDRRSKAAQERERRQEARQHGNSSAHDGDGNSSATLPLPAVLLGGNHRNCKGSLSSFSACNATCGGGYQARNYTVTAKPKGKEACNITNGATELRECNTESCVV